MSAPDLAVLGSRLASGRPVFSTAEARGYPRLRSAGLIVVGGYDPSVNLPWDAVDLFQVDGRGRGYYHDPASGMRVDVPAEDLVVWNISTVALVEKLTAAFRCHDGTAAPRTGEVWDLGESGVPVGRYRRRVLFVRDLASPGTAEALETAPGANSAIIVVGCLIDPTVLGDRAGRSFELCDVAALREDGEIEVDWDRIKARMAPEPSPAARRPSSRKSAAEVHAAKLLQEIKEHERVIRKMELDGRYGAIGPYVKKLSVKLIAGKAGVPYDAAARCFRLGREKGASGLLKVLVYAWDRCLEGGRTGV